MTPGTQIWRIALGVVGERNGFRIEGVKSGPIAPSPLFHGAGLGPKKFGCCALGWVNSSSRGGPR